jgi:tetratricopeptide (TPR) repeat protein
VWPSLFSAGLASWWERRRALKEIREFSDQEKETLTLNDANPVLLAKSALSLNSRPEALRQWRAAMDRHPSFAKTHRESLGIMLGLELFDEAESVMLEGTHQAPRDPFYAGGYAEVAERRGDDAEALQRWQTVRKRFPNWWKGHVHTARCLRRTGEVNRSEELLRYAIGAFPDSLLVWMEWGRAAEFRSDWAESGRRWDFVYQRFGHPVGALGAAFALEGLGRLDEAEKQLVAARMRFPLELAIYIALARIAYARCDPNGALHWWTEIRERFPLLPVGYQGEVRLLRELQRYADAEIITLEGVDRFPNEQWPIVEYATLADDSQDWTGAVERWAAVRSAWPSRNDGYLRAAEALSKLGRDAEALELRAELRRR